MRERYLVQLVDALLHTADGGHCSQSVSVEVFEAVLPADLKQGNHSSFLWKKNRTSFIFNTENTNVSYTFYKPYI